MADLNGVIGFVYRYKRRKRPADPPVTTADPTSEAPPPPHLKPRPLHIKGTLKSVLQLLSHVWNRLGGAFHLKEWLKCTLLRFSFSGSWDAMWENSRKMSRYVASPGEARDGNADWSRLRGLHPPQTSLFTQHKQPNGPRGLRRRPLSGPHTLGLCFMCNHGNHWIH